MENIFSLDTALFFGRFHPLMVHLPIGMVSAAFVLQVLGLWHQKNDFVKANSILLMLSTLSAAVACGAGLLLAEGGGYEYELLEDHKYFGIALAAACAASWLLYVFYAKAKWLHTGLLTVCMGLMSVAGHHGGSLTHGQTYLTDYMPNQARTLVGLPPKAEKKKAKVITNYREALVFEDIIFPELEAHCVSCHNAGKIKGGLRLDSHAELMQGGENGKVILAGNAAGSELFKLVNLPRDQERAMPPDGKKPLDKETIDLIQWWVDNGAAENKKVAELPENKDIAAVLQRKFGGKQAEQSAVFSLDIPHAPDEVLAQLRKEGFVITPIYAGAPYLEVSVSASAAPELTDEKFKKLESISQQIVWLNLAICPQVSAGILQQIPTFKHLNKLYLQNTPTTDAGIAGIRELPYLQFVNLYNTQVSEQAKADLRKAKSKPKVF